MRSFRTNQAIDKIGKPIPWYTYSFLHFIEPRLKQNFRVFEYGCGNSTLYYSTRVKEVVAVEHDPSWFQRIIKMLPPNSKVICKPFHSEYVDEIRNHGLFDIVVIDGICRVECGKAALTALKLEGIIIWDNSDRPEFLEIFPFFNAHGFQELPFYGMAPISFAPSQTSVLYRSGNCLGI